ncbi:MAG: type II/IV secretion system ATPase subunit [Candidatus Bathyarchaeia archaeon]|nr:type II/IV secretion system ATPase subunit [Candidatus Bathyarchaeota archaeon]
MRLQLKNGERPRKVQEDLISPYEYEIPKTFDEALQKFPYLKSYVETNGLRPIYTANPSELALDALHLSTADVLYPVGLGIFVHVKVGGEIGKYNIIEPKKPSQDLLDKFEDILAKEITERSIVAETTKEKEQAIFEIFNRVVSSGKLKIPESERRDFIYHFIREKLGHGIIDCFLADPWLEDVSVPGAGKIYVVHKFFGSLESNLEISKEEIDTLLRSIAERYGKVLSYTHPILDIHLPDGSRFNIVFGEDISIRGSNFTIRKFPKEPISVAHLIRWRTISEMVAAYMWMLLEVGVSFFMCGETASGKTTSLNAFAGLIRPDAKIVSIEETPEVNLAHKNWVREVTRLHTGSKVTMFDLLKAALRQRPDYIIVGEIRGEEGQIAFQAIETGHPVISTIHAGDLETLFQRLTSPPINVPKTHINGLNIAIFQNRIKRGLKLVRRVLSVNEIIGYDPEENSLNYLPVFLYDADRDELRFTGSSFLLEAKVLPFRGWGTDKLPKLYEELRMRAEILRFLSENYPSFRDVWNTVVEVENRGVEEVYKNIKEGNIPWIKYRG